LPLPLSHYHEYQSTTASRSSTDTDTFVSREQGPGRSVASRRTVHRRASVPWQPLLLHLAPFLLYGQLDEELIRPDLIQADVNSQVCARKELVSPSETKCISRSGDPGKVIDYRRLAKVFQLQKSAVSRRFLVGKPGVSNVHAGEAEGTHRCRPRRSESLLTTRLAIRLFWNFYIQKASIPNQIPISICTPSVVPAAWFASVHLLDSSFRISCSAWTQS
jgi:hypothetical protein